MERRWYCAAGCSDVPFGMDRRMAMPDRCRWPQGRCRCDNGTRANPETGPPFSSPRPKGVEGAVARCAGIPMRSAPVVVDELNEMYALCGVWE
jgi:hypothetical protein